MIIKNFDLQKINLVDYNFFLFYGENEGLKEDIINRLFLNSAEIIKRYDENEILEKKDDVISSILNKSFFNKSEIIVISRVSEKILKFIDDIVDKQISEVKIILKSNILAKKSSLRAFFEKEKNLVCVPFYSDEKQTLAKIALSFFKDKSVSISQESINELVDICHGDRKNLENELGKVEIYTNDKKKISIEEIKKLTNIGENFSVSELTDSCLSKNFERTIKILNENYYTIDDCILIIRSLLSKSRRLLSLKSKYDNSKNLDSEISSHKPPIFWKEKKIVKKQVLSWELDEIEKLIININNIEALIKKNSNNAINVIYDFILNAGKKISN